MASNSLSNNNRSKTRLQEATERQNVVEEMRLIEEAKRQKLLFAPGNVIGPRDIPIDSNLPIIKTEDNLTETPTVKQELVEVEQDFAGSEQNSVNFNVSKTSLEDDEDSLVVKVEEIIDLDESTFTEQVDVTFEPSELNFSPVNGTSVEHETTLPENENLTSDPENGKFSQNYIRLLQSFDNQKDKEISLLQDLIKELQLNVLDTEASGSRSSNTLVVSQFTSDINRKDVKIKILYLEMLKLQNENISKSDNSPQANKTGHSQDDSTISENAPTASKVTRQSARLALKKMDNKKVKEKAAAAVLPKPKAKNRKLLKSKPKTIDKKLSNNATSPRIDGDEDKFLYECRICAQRFTAAEKISHPAMHTQQELNELAARIDSSKTLWEQDNRNKHKRYYNMNVPWGMF